MDLNRATILGRLTADPEARTTPSGQSVVSFSVATNLTWTDSSSGEKKEKTEFHNIVAWRKLAEIISQYLKKGSRVYIEGRLQTRSWDDQNGVKKYRTEIIAENMIMLDSRNQNDSTAPSPSNSNNASNTSSDKKNDSGEEEINIEHIPF